MPRYETILEVLTTIQKRFARVRRLNREGKANSDSTCYYAPKVNTIGCAIGCLLDKQDARSWDKSFHVNGIDTILSLDRDGYAKYFKDDIATLTVLRKVQKFHDTAEDTKEFRKQLRDLIQIYA